MVSHSNQIGDFKAKFDGGTRPNRFVIDGEIGPSTAGGQSTSGPANIEPLLVKAGSMPVQTVGILQIPFRGRIAKLPGDRVYAEWTFTVIDDITENYRRKFEGWHESFNPHEENVVDSQEILNGTDTNYYTQWNVTQLDMTGKEVRKVTLVNCWPVEIGAIDLSYDTADTLTEYSVTLAYDYLKLA